MAILTYKTVINNAIQGFTDIQGALANFVDLGLAAVSTKVNGDKTGNKTPAQMVEYINKLASIKNGEDFISGQIAYHSIDATQNGLINASTGIVSYSYTIPAGYYPGTTKVSGTVNLGISTGTIVDGDISEPSAIASISQTDGTLAKLVENETNINTGIITTQPASGTLGADYWAIVPAISASNGSVNASIAQATYGFTDANNSFATGTNRTLTPTTTLGATYYVNKAVVETNTESNISVDKISDAETINSILLGSSTTTKPSAGYYIGIEGTGSTGNIKSTVGGYLPLNSTYSLTPNSQTAYFPISAASFSSTNGTINLGVNSSDGASSGTNISTSVGTPTSTEPTSGYYVYIDGSGNSGNVKTSSAGYTPLNQQTNVLITSKSEYFPINSGAVSVSFDSSSIGAVDVELASGVTGTNVVTSGTNISETLPTATDHFYIPVSTVGTSAAIKATASLTSAGYIGNSYSADKTQTIFAGGGETRYIGVSAGNYSASVAYTSPHVTVSNTETGFVKATGVTQHYVTSNGVNSSNGTALGTATIGTEGYIATGNKSSSQASFAPIINGSASYNEIIYIPDGIAHNGYVTTSGFIERDISDYTLSYDSTNECVNFVWNN